MKWEQRDKDASPQHETHNPQWMERGLQMVYGKREDDWGERAQQVYSQRQPPGNLGQVEYMNWTAPTVEAGHVAQAADKVSYSSKGGNWVEANNPVDGGGSGAPTYYEMPAQHMMRTSRQTPSWSSHTVRMNPHYGRNLRQEIWRPDDREVSGIGATKGGCWPGMGRRPGVERM